MTSTSCACDSEKHLDTLRGWIVTKNIDISTDEKLMGLAGREGVTEATECNAGGFKFQNADRARICGHMNLSTHNLNRVDVVHPDNILKADSMIVLGEGTQSGLCFITGLPCLSLMLLNLPDVIEG